MNIFGLRIEFKNLMAETDRSQCTSSQFTIWTPGHQFGPVRDIAQTPRPLTIIAPANPTGLGLLNRPLQHTPLGDLGSCAIKNRGLKTEVPCLIFVCLFSFLLFGFKKNPNQIFPTTGWVGSTPQVTQPENSGEKKHHRPASGRVPCLSFGTLECHCGRQLHGFVSCLSGRKAVFRPFRRRWRRVNGHGAFITKSNGGKWHGHFCMEITKHQYILWWYQVIQNNSSSKNKSLETSYNSESILVEVVLDRSW